MARMPAAAERSGAALISERHNPAPQCMGASVQGPPLISVSS
jgi:hypothetical protein